MSESSFQLSTRSARELCALPDPPASDLLVGPLVIRGARTIVLGDTGAGKTSLCLQLVRAMLTGSEVLGYTGSGTGPCLFIDLEQGLRTIKRALRESGLDEREDLLYVTAPDGLALDSNEAHRAEVERVISLHKPPLVCLDPYYKAHQGDANEERAVVDLMRFLDRLRAQYQFALLLPAHPRKDPTSNEVRRLTLHDVAGSGAAVRGAEVVIGLERLSHGYARLRILKDRDSDLPVGDAWPLVFDQGEGFKLDPKEERSAEELEQRILADDGTWRTVKEYAALLGIREKRARELLERLAECGKVEPQIGAPGRSSRAHLYRPLGTAPALWAQSGAVAQSDSAGTAPVAGGAPLGGPPSGAVPRPLIPDDGSSKNEQEDEAEGLEWR